MITQPQHNKTSKTLIRTIIRGKIMKSTYHKTLFIFLVLLVISCNFVSSFTPTAEGNSTPGIGPSQIALESTSENSINIQSSLTTFPGFTSVQPPSTKILDNPSALTELAYWRSGSFGHYNEAELSHNGKIIAIATSVGLYIYNAETFEQIQFIEYYAIEHISLAPEGDFVAFTERISETDSTAVYIYNTNTKELVKTMTVEKYPGFPLYSPDGRQFIVLSSRSESSVYSASDFDLLYTVKDVDGLGAYSQNGKYLAVTAKGGVINIIDAGSGAVLNIIQQGDVTTLTFSPDEKQLAVVSGDNGTLNIWGLDESKIIQTIETKQDTSLSDSLSITYSPDGKQIAVRSSELIYLFYTATGERIKALNDETYYGYTRSYNAKVLNFFPNGSQLLAAVDGAVFVLDLNIDKPIYTFEFYKSLDNQITYLPNDKIIDIGFDYAIRVWDINTGKLLNRLASEETDYTRQIARIRYSPNGDEIAAIHTSSAIQVWDTNTGLLLHKFTEYEGKLIDALFIQDRWQVLINLDGLLQIWDLETNEMVHAIETTQQDIRVVTVSPDGQQLATGDGLPSEGNNATIKIWDLQTEQLLQNFKTSATSVDKLVYSPDGQQLVSVGAGTTIWSWNISTGDSRFLYEQMSYIPFITYIPDSRIMVASINDGLGFFDTNTGKNITTIPIWGSVNFSSDGKLLIVTGDGVRFFGIP
jgi:WD40 repeat protein